MHRGSTIIMNLPLFPTPTSASSLNTHYGTTSTIMVQNIIPLEPSRNFSTLMSQHSIVVISLTTGYCQRTTMSWSNQWSVQKIIPAP